MAKYADVTLGQVEACINRLGGMQSFLRFIGGQGKIVFDSIMSWLRTVRIAAQPAVTTTEMFFRQAGVKYMGESFRDQLLGVEVLATNEVELAVRKLEENSRDAAIVAELGDKAEITLSQFRMFLALNPKSSEPFIFYLRGKDGALWAVYAKWEINGWQVYASYVDVPRTWGAGNRVVSLN